MTDNPFLKVFQVWAAMAWADGRIDDREAAAMTKLIEQAGLEDEVKAQAEAFLQQRVELDPAELAGMPQGAREGIYQAAARLALVDHNLADGEIAFLDKLGGALQLSGDAVASIEAGVGLQRPN